jgi:hypothetical protein
MNWKIIPLLLLPLVVFATNTEDYYGRYYTKQKNCKIHFGLDESGVKDLIVNNVKYDPSKLTYDFLGIYGSTQALQIRFTDSLGYDNLIRVLVAVDDEEFIIASGFYLRSKDCNEKSIYDKKCAIELFRIKATQ